MRGAARWRCSRRVGGLTRARDCGQLHHHRRSSDRFVGLGPASGSVRWDVEVFSLLLATDDQTSTQRTGWSGGGSQCGSGEILWRQTGLKFRFPVVQ